MNFVKRKGSLTVKMTVTDFEAVKSNLSLMSVQ